VSHEVNSGEHATWVAATAAAEPSSNQYLQVIITVPEYLIHRAQQSAYRSFRPSDHAECWAR
jgi:hypothetical protein